jgi:membrane protein
LPDLTDAARQLEGFSQKVSIGAVGASGLLFTLGTCYALYSSVEKIYNDIWRVGVRRKRLGKVVTFAALITLLPFLAGAYLYWSGRLAGSGAAERFIGPLAIQFAAILLTNKLLPNTRVTWRAAVAGTVASGLLLEGGRALFVGFAKRTLLASYSGVYGPLALVPMMLIWIYVAWLLILLGAEVARAVAKTSTTSADSLMSADAHPIVGR